MFFSLFIFSEIRKRSKAESSKYQDDFDVYVQALISQSLDSNFLEEVYADKGNKLDPLFLKIWFDFINLANWLRSWDYDLGPIFFSS